MRFRSALLVLPLAVACDATVTDIGQLDVDLLAQVARISDGSMTPAEGVLVDLLRHADDGTAAGRSIPQLDSLFTLVVSDRSPDFARDAETAAARYDGIWTDAWRRIDGGDTAAGERRLMDARRFQSALVADRLGRAGAIGYVALVSGSLEQSAGSVSQRTPRRSRAMLDSARDLTDDARDAVREGRIADAFDLASHAAGLANVLAAGGTRR